MMNRVVLIGRLTKDPELLYTKQGIAYMKVRIAVSRGYRNSQGEQETDFIDCNVWRKMAENVSLYCKKGALIGISGRIRTSSFENEQGKRMYRTEITAENLSFLERKKIQTSR
ncbi:single-stranded DNA-binding protein [Ectobacillus antri]|uniref:single-stranded DNA-binding protein n=1 Tax=Ectobacillus antri TaxID=2486280 RepID=UPI000F5B46A8|nr:single-stranded DNA-binding protein [Ectobacillus antri]